MWEDLPCKLKITLFIKVNFSIIKSGITSSFFSVKIMPELYILVLIFFFCRKSKKEIISGCRRGFPPDKVISLRPKEIVCSSKQIPTLMSGAF